MADYDFITIAFGGGVLNGFDPLADTLAISGNASSATVLSDDGTDTTITAGGNTVIVTNVLVHQLTSSNLLTNDGSLFLIGDNSAVADPSGDNASLSINRSGSNTNDLIIGFDGNDTIVGSQGDTRIFGGAGNDSIMGLNGINNIFGGDGNDYLETGDTNSAILEGGSGNDTLIGGAGINRLTGGTGADVLDGGGGLDSAAFDGGGPGLIAILELQYQIYNAGDALGDQYFNIENMSGTGFDDFLGGNGVNNVIAGGAGNDQLFGLDGVDTLSGGEGDDTLSGGKDGDLLNGLNGSDTASYKVLSGKVTASLSDRSKNTGQAEGDRYLSIENLEGSFGSDSLEGDSNANILWGVGNRDTLSGLGGDDTLDGGARADVLNGGSGFDYASYESSGAGVTAILLGGYEYLTTGHAANDSYISIEGLVGSNRNDILAGNNGANEILGLAGNDFLIGVNGNDTLDGGVGNDTLNGGLPFNPSGFGSDRFVFKTGYDNDTIDGFAAGAGSEDVIALSLGTSFDEFSEIQSAASDVGGNTLLSFGGGDSLTLIGVSAASLHQDDFVFV